MFVVYILLCVAVPPSLGGVDFFTDLLFVGSLFMYSGNRGRVSISAPEFILQFSLNTF